MERMQARRGRLFGVIAAMVALMMALLVSEVVLPDRAYADPETVTIGTGTQATAYAPLRNRDSNGQTQAIYTASEIGTSGTIKTLAYNVAGTNASYAITNLRIWMGYTSLEKFTSVSQALKDGLTLVYDGVPSPMLGSAAGWQTLTLTNGFDYDASKGNLVIVVGTQSTKYQSSVTFYYSSTSSILTRGNDSAATVADLNYSGTVAFTARDERPNIQLGIETCSHDNATFIKTIAPTCEEKGYDVYHCAGHERQLHGRGHHRQLLRCAYRRPAVRCQQRRVGAG